ncbi:MAG TPA: DUF362 domain-containing protein [Candidatus Acidoferrum sp.]|jgi:uncharacterized protein (DUF362 family)|nr:DUF362 domain-containing protein [Candidatus Acidoferrum sp.]
MITRRNLLHSVAGMAAAGLVRAADAPAAAVAVTRCRTYSAAELMASLEKLFDQIGGLGRIVKGKTVGVKINLTGAPSYRLGHLPLGDTHYTNPQLIGAALHLMGKAGAKRIRVLESPWSTADPLEEYMLLANWEPRDILGAAPNVEFENTNYLGRAKQYSRVMVPGGGYIFPGFDLNHSYVDCDAFVSMAKLKEHGVAGVTLSLKNCFGITPATIYGTGSGEDEPTVLPRGGRQIIHSGARQPSRSAPQEHDLSTPRQPGYRVPRVVVDLVKSRPIDLAIVDGVKTMTGAEGPWGREVISAVSPGVLVAGTNPVNTDAVCMSVMGFDPMADRGTPPFETADSTLALAERAGIGTRDLKRIEVSGLPLTEPAFDFAALRRQRRQQAAAKDQG